MPTTSQNMLHKKNIGLCTILPLLLAIKIGGRNGQISAFLHPYSQTCRYSHATTNSIISQTCPPIGRRSQKLHANDNLAKTTTSSSDDNSIIDGQENVIASSIETASSASSAIATGKRARFRAALPNLKTSRFGDSTDTKILNTALPSMLNMAVVPLVNSVDTFWVGRLGIALALAGQAAANQAFFTLYFLVSFLPTMTAPLIAQAVGSGDMESAQDRVCEALFLSNLFGLVGTIMLVGFPRTTLGLVLAKDSPSMVYAVPYLRFRALSMIPALLSATGFAAYRGMLDTVTPLKVSLLTNLSNLIADPMLIFGLPITRGLGVSGAAIATAGAETLSGIVYLRLLLKNKLVRFSKLLRPPAWSRLKPLIQGGAAIFARNLTLNAAFLAAARRAQSMDSTGVMAAAYGIVMQIYSVGVVCHLGIQSTAAALVSATRASDGDDAARSIADRTFVWGSIVGVVLGITQVLALPVLVPLFSTIPEVQEAVKVPALISSCIHIMNGPLFAGEGVMLGLGTFKALAVSTAMGTGIMVLSLLSPLGKQLNGILLSLATFNLFQALAMVFHYLKLGPLATSRDRKAV